MTQVKDKPMEKKDFPFATYFEYYNQFLDTKLAKSLRLRKLSERFVYLGAKNGSKVATTISKAFKSSSKGNAAHLDAKTPHDLFDLNYDEEQMMVQETVQQFALKMRLAAENIDESALIPESLWTAFRDLQLGYLQVPDALGGMMKERSTVTQMMIVETLAHGDLGQALAFYSTHSVLNAIVKWGSETQQQELIPPFLSENPLLASIAINEPLPLFSPFEVQTNAVRNGQDYLINGKKNIVPLGNDASFFLVAAKTADLGIQLFIVDNHVEGLSIEEDRSMGLNAAGLTTLHFKDVRIDKSAMLGGDDGMDYTSFINYCKLGWCALATGCCQAVLDYVIPYANDRYAFGEPISHRQAVAFMIADIKIEVDGMRLLTQRAAARAEQGLDFQREVYLAHIFCSEKGMQIGSNGVQLLGGHGYIRDFPVERWYRDLRAVALAINGIHL